MSQQNRANDDADDSCTDDQQNQRDIRTQIQQENQQIKEDCEGIGDRLLPQSYDGVENQHDDADADAGEGIMNDLVTGEVLQKGSDYHQKQQGDSNKTQSGNDTAKKSLTLIADEGGYVDGNDAGGTLTDGIVIRQFLIGYPAKLIYELVSQQRKHGIAAAEVDGTDPQEDTIKF